MEILRALVRTTEDVERYCPSTEVVFGNKTLPAERLTVDVDRSEGAINEKLEGRRKVFVGLVFARRRNALLKLLDRDLAVLQEGKRK